MTTTNIVRKLGRAAIVPVAAAALVFGGGGIGAADAAPRAQAQNEECEADRSNHLLGGLLTGPLTFVSNLLPFTIAGEQYPVCDED